MLLVVLLSCLALVTKDVDAAVRVPAASLVQETMSKRSSVDPPPTETTPQRHPAPPTETTTQRLSTLLQLTSEEDIVSERSTNTVSGTVKTRYHQTYKGIPVYDTIVTSDDAAHDISGSLVKEISQDVHDVTPKITTDEAVRIAKQAEKDDKQPDAKIDVQEVKQYIYMDSEGKARLVYQVKYYIESEDKISRPFYIIDAKSGKILDHWQGLHFNYEIKGEGGNLKTGKYLYDGSKYGKLKVTADGAKTYCTFSNVNVQVEHMHNKYSSNGASYRVLCSVGAKDAANGAYSPVNDALYFGGVVFDMFKNWYDTSPLNTKLYMRVHYGSNYENAFWNGVQMTFGDGRTRFYPLVSLDVTAHEVAHGFTDKYSDLEYKSQSGGINEAFSDMAGEAAEYYMRGTNDFMVGYDIVKAANAGLRYMFNPPQDGKSIDHQSKYYEGLNVHYSSGIYNKAFYLLASKSCWNTRKAFEVMVLANMMYWGKTTKFNEGVCGVQKAAKDRGYSEKDVIDAFKVVGVTCSTSVQCASHKRIIVCEHRGGKTISCPSGTVISIIGANYGRLENQCLVHHVKNCVAYGSTAKTRARCDGKSSCYLLAANSIYGDPCWGVQKYLDVKYACLPADAKQVTICEHGTKTISCPAGKTLEIVYANYGRVDPETCGRVKYVNCGASTSCLRVTQNCYGKTSCFLHASNGVFGDPCWGIYKYLVVKYRCN